MQESYRRGDLAQATAEALDHAGRWRGDRNSPWYWNFRLLAAEALTAQAKYGEAEELLRDPIPTQLEQQRWRALVDRASLKVSRSRDATDDLRQMRGSVRDPELAIRIELIDGIQSLNEHRNERAQELFHAALDRSVRYGDPYYRASALNDLSFSSKRLNRYEESIDFGERAIAEAAKAGAIRIEAIGHQNLGTSYGFVGELDAALKHERKAVEMLRQMGMRSAQMIALGELGLIYHRADNVRDAAQCYREAYEMAQQLDSKRDATRFAENLAVLLARTEQWQEAAEWNRRAEELAAVTGENLAYLARNRAFIAFGLGHTAEAVRISNDLLKDPKTPTELRWVAYDLLGTIDAKAGRASDANREFANALRAIDGAQSALANSHYKITLLSYLIPFYQDYVEILVRQNDDAGALRTVESSRARVLAERMEREFPAGALPPVASVREFARSAKVSVLSFWVAPSRSFAWLIRPEGVRRFELPPAAELEALVTGYRKIVEHSVQDPLTTADPALWNRVMAPIAAAIPKGSRVIVIPDGPLHRLNLETLVVPGGAGAPAHYWIEDAEVAVAPSIAIAMAKAPAPHCERGLLVIGDPDYRGTGYDPLPGAAKEVSEVEARFGGVAPAVYTGAQASPAAYRQADPGRFSVIHFAAHAEANVEKPLESAVVLARQGDSYKLYARDVVGIPIHADLVTLSACRSAGAREYAGEGLIGFAWAFLQAGALSVVAGLWDVSDISSGPLMSRFYEGVAAKHDTVTALREAKLALLHGDARFHKAFYWGAFQVYVGAAGK